MRAFAKWFSRKGGLQYLSHRENWDICFEGVVTHFCSHIRRFGGMQPMLSLQIPRIYLNFFEIAS